jgi:beta-glucosidase-like glycosyl hydrolase
VVSDFGAVHSTAPSLSAGFDQELNVPVYYTPADIGAALAAGQVTLAQINQAVFRVIRAYIQARLFDLRCPPRRRRARPGAAVVDHDRPRSAAHPLSYWDTANQAWATAAGTSGVQAGSSSDDLPLSGAVQVAR